MKKLVVIGGGPGGNVAAIAAARHGKGSVVLVEREDLGGTCTNRGCIPTKFLLSRLEQAGQESAASWRKLMAHKDALVRGLASSIGRSCREAGVEVVEGHGRLAGANTVEVERKKGRPGKIEAEQVIIATGSAPAAIPGVEADGGSVITSTEALGLASPPRSMVVIGTGAVGSEFAFIFHRAGTRVTLVEAMDRLFPGEDSEVHDLFERLYRKMGIETVVSDPVVAVEPAGNGGARVVLRSGARLEAEKVLIGVGRHLLSGDIGLETVGISPGERGEILVDGELRTSASGIFAVGDVTGRLLLAHLASFQGLQAAMHAIGRKGREIPYHAVPWSIFTTPEIATVGVNETSAGERGEGCISAVVPWMENIKARIDKKTEGFVKIVADSASGRIIGGTIVGDHASDMVHVISAAIHQGLTAREMSGMVFSHPGLAESIHEALQKLQHRLSPPGGE